MRRAEIWKMGFIEACGVRREKSVTVCPSSYLLFVDGVSLLDVGIHSIIQDIFLFSSFKLGGIPLFQSSYK